jgi:hypothetical protein
VQNLPGEEDSGSNDSDVVIVKDKAGLTDALYHDVVSHVVTQLIQADFGNIRGTGLIPPRTSPANK